MSIPLSSYLVSFSDRKKLEQKDQEKLTDAYKADNEPDMSEAMIDIMELCKITSGKVKGINNKIKSLRRQEYANPDDEYFFLKLFDVSRKSYVRNIPSHKILE